MITSKFGGLFSANAGDKKSIDDAMRAEKNFILTVLPF